MTRIVFLSPQGTVAATVDARPGESVMKAAVGANVRGIEAECGGSLTCATCHVYVGERDAARVLPPTADELGMLEFVAAERRPTSRLSCQIVASGELGELEVQLPDKQIE